MKRHSNIPAVIIQKHADKCKECGNICSECYSNNSLDLHHTIEELKAKLADSKSRVSQLERDFTLNQTTFEQETYKLQDECIKLRDRYDRLYDSHCKLQKLNQELEEKLLSAVERFNAEKTHLSQTMMSLRSKLAEARLNIYEMEIECDRYKNDCNLAVQLLKCNPSSFIPQKLNSLPANFQDRVKSRLSHKEMLSLEKSDAISEQSSKTIRVPMPTFPPTAMVYSIQRSVSQPRSLSTFDGQGLNNPDFVPISAITETLSQSPPVRESSQSFTCRRCQSSIRLADRTTQTGDETHQGSTDDGRRPRAIFHMPCISPESIISKQPRQERICLNSVETEI